MRIKQAIERIPGGLMIVPLILGAMLNTLDQMHLPFVQDWLARLGTTKSPNGSYEFLHIGGFAQALFKTGAMTLIGLFLFCAGSQMNLRAGSRSIIKGSLLTTSKYLTGLAVGVLFGRLSDPFHGFLGLSTLAIIAAMTNGNGGMYVALTGHYGNRSDVGAVSVLSLNDGPFFTLMSLGLLGYDFPIIAFVAVLLPIGLGMLLGNLDEAIRSFLKPGETMLIPFFAFALGTGMNLSNFLNLQILGAGLALGLATLVLTGAAGVVLFKLFRQGSTIAPVAEASTAGNAVATPAAIAAAAAAAAASGKMGLEQAQRFQDIAAVAAAQISISTLTTAVLCPFAVMLWDRRHRRRGIDGKQEHSQALSPFSGVGGLIGVAIGYWHHGVFGAMIGVVLGSMLLAAAMSYCHGLWARGASLTRRAMAFSYVLALPGICLGVLLARLLLGALDLTEEVLYGKFMSYLVSVPVAGIAAMIPAWLAGVRQDDSA